MDAIVRGDNDREMHPSHRLARSCQANFRSRQTSSLVALKTCKFFARLPSFVHSNKAPIDFSNIVGGVPLLLVCLNSIAADQTLPNDSGWGGLIQGANQRRCSSAML